jgi:MFS family permease
MSLRDDLSLSRPAAAAFAAVGLYWGAFAAQVPVLKAAIEVSDGLFGVVLLIGSGGAVLAMWLAPPFERMLGRQAMPVCAVLMALAFLLPGLTTGPWGFALAMILAASSSGCLDVIMNARLSALEQRRGRVLMNLNHGVFSLSYAGSAILTGLAREAGWPPLAVFGAAGLVCFWLVAWMRRLPEDARDAPSATGNPAGLRRSVVVLGGAIILIAFLAEQGTEGWSALHLERTLGAGAAGGALGPGLLGLTMAIGRIGGHVLGSGLPAQRVIRWAATVSALGAVLAAAAPAVWVAYVGFAILGLGLSVVAPMTYVIVGRDVPEAGRTIAIARISAIGYLGFFIGPPAMGFLSQGFGLYASFLFVALLLLMVPLLLVPAYARIRPVAAASGM